MKQSTKENIGMIAIAIFGIAFCATIAAGIYAGGFYIVPCCISAVADAAVIKYIHNLITK